MTRRDYQDERDAYIDTVRTMQETARKTGVPPAFHPAEKFFNAARLRRYKQEIRPALTRKIFSF